MMAASSDATRPLQELNGAIGGLGSSEREGPTGARERGARWDCFNPVAFGAL